MSCGIGAGLLRLALISRARRSVAGHELQRVNDEVPEVLSLHDRIEHPVFKQEFGALKSLGQLLLDSLLDHARPCKADQSARLRDVKIAQHRKARGHAASGWIRENGYERQAFFIEPRKGGRDLSHLHQRYSALLHAGAT